MASSTAHHDARIAQMSFASVYPHYVTKVVKKGRTEVELRTVFSWLTGLEDAALDAHLKAKTSFEDFFRSTKLHPNASLIKGVICGCRVEDIENPLTQKVRYLDKVVDELAKGKALEKICRE